MNRSIIVCMWNAPILINTILDQNVFMEGDKYVYSCNFLIQWMTFAEYYLTDTMVTNDVDVNDYRRSKFWNNQD